MPRRTHLIFALCAFLLWRTAFAMPIEALTEPQRRQLTLFGMRAMGLKVSDQDLKVTLPLEDVRQMIAGGLNLNGHLCARPLDVTPLPKAGRFEATCIAVRGGRATKNYLIDCASGKAEAL